MNCTTASTQHQKVTEWFQTHPIIPLSLRYDTKSMMVWMISSSAILRAPVKRTRQQQLTLCHLEFTAQQKPCGIYTVQKKKEKKFGSNTRWPSSGHVRLRNRPVLKSSSWPMSLLPARPGLSPRVLCPSIPSGQWGVSTVVIVIWRERGSASESALH